MDLFQNGFFGNLNFSNFLAAMLKTSYYGSSFDVKVKITYADICAMKNLYSNIYVMLNPCNNKVTITSGYRDVPTNKYVKGRSNSQHLYGEAMDFQCNNMPAMFDFISQNLEYDQLIWEKGTKDCPKWIHVSYSSRHSNRKQVILNYK